MQLTSKGLGVKSFLTMAKEGGYVTVLYAVRLWMTDSAMVIVTQQGELS